MTLSKIEKDHIKKLGITEAQHKEYQRIYDKAEKEGSIIPIEIDEEGYPCVTLEMKEKQNGK